MVAAKYGSADPDIGSRVGKKGKTKEIADRPLAAAGSDPGISAKVGGINNPPPGASVKPNVSSKKTGARQQFAKGGSVQSTGIPPYKEGGFRNNGMVNRR